MMAWNAPVGGGGCRGLVAEEVSEMSMCMQMMQMLRDMWNMMFPTMPM
ncbi:MAG: hypothetical protein H5T78_17270 [Nocardia sp.]|nr:hypothetical protein [Nocardia sp.]